MEKLSLQLDDLSQKYRKIFLTTALEISEIVSMLKPDGVEGDIFDDYDKNTLGNEWQIKVSEILKTAYYPKLKIFDAEIIKMRENSSCVGCGSCCRLACSEFSYSQLKTKAENGDNYAIQFVNTFMPYEGADEVLNVYPEYLQMLKERKEKGYYFYHCPKVTKDNRCPDYENRPQICREFPDNPLGFLPKLCGYSSWKSQVQDLALQRNALNAILGFYFEHLKK